MPGPDELDDLPDSVLSLDASAVFDHQAQELLWLLAIAIERLGGAMVVAAEEIRLHRGYSLGVDMKFQAETGGIRLFAIVDDMEEDA